MAGEGLDFTKVPQEAKSVNEFMIWAGKHGQAESAQQLIDAVQHQDWAAAGKAFDKLDDYAKATDAVKELGDTMSTIENMGKAIEVAEKVSNGDYLGASVQAGAEVVDATASKFLQQQGPGGIALDYLAHKSGEELAEKLHEYQGFKDQEVLSQADINAASVASWQHEREFVEQGVRERIEAGQSPEEASAWARDHIESHGAIYRDLENMDGGFGDSSQNRQVTDQLWIVDRANEMAEDFETAQAEKELATKQTGDGNNEGGFFSNLWNQGVEAMKEVFSGDAHTEEDTPDTTPEEVPEEASEVPKDNTRDSIHAETQPETQAEPVAAEPVAAEPVAAEPVAAEPATATDMEPEIITAQPETEFFEIPLPTEVDVEEVFVTTAEQWDDDIAAMAREGSQPEDLTVAEHDAIVHEIAEGEPVIFEAEPDPDPGYENSYEDFEREQEDTYTA